MNGMVLFSSVGWGFDCFVIISNVSLSRLIDWVINYDKLGGYLLAVKFACIFLELSRRRLLSSKFCEGRWLDCILFEKQSRSGSSEASPSGSTWFKYYQYVYYTVLQIVSVQE